MAGSKRGGEDKSKKPLNTKFRQQTLTAWQPILTPKYVIGSFALISIVFIPIGLSLLSTSDSVVEAVEQYDGDGADEAKYGDCFLTAEGAAAGNATLCTVSFTAAADMAKPVDVYYQITNFYQNHRRYVKSRSDAQLRGDEGIEDADLERACDPETSYQKPAGCNLGPAFDSETSCDNANGKWTGPRIYWPCGLVANSYFNDGIALTAPAGAALDSTGIAWSSDVTARYKNPAALDTDKYAYLWDTYPNTINPPCASPAAAAPRCNAANYDATLANAGLLDERFMVWMRTAGLPTFRKLYGRLDRDVKAGEVVSFDVDPRFVVASFGGKKFLVLSTSSWIGGKNAFIGTAFVAVGAVALAFAAMFFAKHRVAPRKLGDTRYLVWKSR